jgi:archaellum component FlaC
METSSTDKRLDDLSDRLGRFEDNVGRRFDQVDRKFDKIDDRFDKIDDRFDKIDERFLTKEQFEMAASETKERFERVEASIAGLGERLDRMNRTVTGSFLTIVAAVIIKLFVA